jgi:NAD+ synthase (glutamine-hydrolysing)
MPTRAWAWHRYRKGSTLNRFRLAAAALNQTPLDWNTNGRHILAVVARAREIGVGVLCLPELCITGYGCEDMFFSAGVRETALEQLAAIVQETGGLVASIGLPVFYEGAVFNCAALACDGRLLGIVAKQHLAGDGIHYEPRWFRRWPAGQVGAVEVGGRTCPIGDLLFDCGGVRIGMEICRDAWVADRTGARLAQRGADVLLNPSASHFAFAKQLIRERFVLEGSRAFCVSYAYANLLGNEAGRAIYDGGTLLASGGRMIARGPRFSFADWLLTSAAVDVEATRKSRAESFTELDQPVAAQGQTIVAEFHYPVVAEAGDAVNVSAGTCGGSPQRVSQENGAVPGHPAWETGPHQKEEEFARAVPLALFDYLRRSRARGLVVSLSGGVDSSTVAVLVYLMVQLGGRELGLAQLADKLAYIPGLREAMGRAEGAGESEFNARARQLVGRLLTCVYQATQHSSAQTLDAARTVADAIGATFIHWNVDALVDQYVATVARAAGREITWDEDDLALQNIQARARGPGIWLLANLRGALLLTTSNRSEAAVGYATMDGDTCGGLAPIAGIDKAFLRDWLTWLETTGPAGLAPLPVLAVVNSQPPTAELRPAAARQTDEGDLMPYRVLDAIERAAIRDKLLPVEVWQSVCPLFPEYDGRQMGQWVERFFSLWCRNQWKRERYAPSFHLDDENLDPKTWCRFPILNSGFERELEALRQRLA